MQFSLLRRLEVARVIGQHVPPSTADRRPPLGLVHRRPGQVRLLRHAYSPDQSFGLMTPPCSQPRTARSTTHPRGPCRGFHLGLPGSPAGVMHIFSGAVFARRAHMFDTRGLRSCNYQTPGSNSALISRHDRARRSANRSLGRLLGPAAGPAPDVLSLGNAVLAPAPNQEAARGSQPRSARSHRRATPSPPPPERRPSSPVHVRVMAACCEC